MTPSSGGATDWIHRPAVLVGLYALLGVLVALLAIPTWGWVYWDFGDGNYLYVARRVREGAVLYRDVLAPQPPLHTAAGVVAQSLGEALLGSALLGVRVYCLAVRLLAGLLVLLLARRIFGCPFHAIAAAGIYLFMPIGFWWTLGYQSENLEIVFLLAALILLVEWTPRRAMLAGMCSALACHCNMTGVPFLLANALFLGFRRPRLLGWYLGGAIPVYTVIAVVANILTHGFFLNNVLFNQVGTFPDSNILSYHNHGDSFWKYAVRKVTTEGGKVLELMGGLIAAAMVGAVLLVRSAPDPAGGDMARAAYHRAEFMAWQLIAGLLTICFVAKGGTVNYIFMLGEPPIALFAAAAMVRGLRAAMPPAGEWRTLSIFNTVPALRAAFPVAVIAIVWAAPVGNLRMTLNQSQTELPDHAANEVRAMIARHAKPGDVILAPPYYAFATDTIVAAELAENYIWNVKYMTEQFYNQRGDATEKMEELAGLIRQRVPRIILLDMALTGTAPPVVNAIAQHYVELSPDPIITRNTRLMVYIPRE